MRIGIDIGGTKAHAIAMDGERNLLGDVRMPSGRGDGVLANVRLAVEQLTRDIAERDGSSGRVESLGIGIPGSVDSDSGVVSHAVNLGIDRLELGAGLADLVDGPVRIDNDVNAAALGAFTLLEEPLESLAYLNVGTGIAAGLVIDGRVWRGHRGIAGEVGHLPFMPDRRPCPCGQRGCIETVASGSAIASAWHESTGGSLGSFAEALAHADPTAQHIRDAVGRGVADAAQVLFLTIGVEAVVLGGGVVENVPGLVESVRDELALRATASSFLASLGLPERIRTAPPGADIPAVGAALLAFQSH